jgi:hypothetical protein
MATTPPAPPPPAPPPWPGPQKPRSLWWRIPLLVGGGILLLGVGIGIGMGLTSEETAAPDTKASPDSTTSPEAVVESPSPEPEPEPPEEPEPPAEPEGDYELASCDLQLGPYQVIGSTRLENTGAVPAEIEVTFTWLFGDGSKQEAEPKAVALAAGAEELVFFKHPVTLNEASSFQDHPDYFDSSNCKTRATILN